MIIPKEKYEFWYLMTTGHLPEDNFRCDDNGYGYKIILAPFCFGYVSEMEHRIIMEEWICRKLKTKEIVHHINGIRDDNRRENLLICNSPSEHMKKYHSPKGKKNPWSDEARENFALRTSGARNHNWRGGISQNYKKRIKKEQVNIT